MGCPAREVATISAPSQDWSSPSPTCSDPSLPQKGMLATGGGRSLSVPHHGTDWHCPSTSAHYFSGAKNVLCNIFTTPRAGSTFVPLVIIESWLDPKIAGIQVRSHQQIQPSPWSSIKYIQNNLQRNSCSTFSLNGIGGTVGSSWNMSSHKSAFMHKARLSTSFAIGPTVPVTGIKRSR